MGNMKMIPLTDEEAFGFVKELTGPQRLLQATNAVDYILGECEQSLRRGFDLLEVGNRETAAYCYGRTAGHVGDAQEKLRVLRALLHATLGDDPEPKLGELTAPPGAVQA